jgi:hypothetical protein
MPYSAALNELLAAAAHEIERDQWRKIEQQNTYFVDGHATVMDGVKSSLRHLKPPAMQVEDPLPGQHEREEPNEQHKVVEHQ